MRTSSAFVMPSCRGQNGMICISPTAPAEDTAHRSKRLSTSMTAMTRPGGSSEPARLAVNMVKDVGALPVILDDLPERGFHGDEPHLPVEFVLEARTG